MINTAVPSGILGLLVLLAWGAMCHAVHAEDPSLSDKRAMWISVDAALKKFAKDEDVKVLSETRRALSHASLGTTERDDKAASDEIVGLMLGVIERCYAVRDKTYDLSAPPAMFTKVAPPLDSGQIIIAGMAPGEIRNLDARRRYEAAIAENDGKILKYRREKAVQALLDECITHLQMEARVRASGSGTNNPVVKAISDRVKDVNLRRRLLSEQREK